MNKKLTSYKALTTFISKNKCLQISGNQLFCNVCNKPVQYVPRSGVRPLNIHINSKAHKTKEQLGNNQKRLDFTLKDSESEENFNSDLIEALISSNIPLHKLCNTMFSGFLEKYTGRKVYSITHYRNKILGNIYEKKLNSIKETLVNAEALYIVFDETIDVCCRNILNVLIGVCKEDKRTRPYLVGV